MFSQSAIRKSISRTAFSTLLMFPSFGRAQEILEDNFVSITCIGLPVILHKIRVACPLSNAEVSSFDAEAGRLQNDLSRAGQVCDAHSIGELSVALQAKARNAISIVNDLDEIAYTSTKICNYSAALTADRARNAAMKIVVNLFVPEKSSEKMSGDFTKENLDSVVDLLPMKEKFKTMYSAYSMFSDPEFDQNMKQFVSDIKDAPVRTIVTTASQQYVSKYTGIGDLIIRLQVKTTPGATITTQEMKTIDFLDNKIPIIIKDTVSHLF